MMRCCEAHYEDACELWSEAKISELEIVAPSECPFCQMSGCAEPEPESDPDDPDEDLEDYPLEG